VYAGRARQLHAEVDQAEQHLAAPSCPTATASCREDLEPPYHRHLCTYLHHSSASCNNCCYSNCSTSTSTPPPQHDTAQLLLLLQKVRTHPSG
jgi:hypothetical protein